MAWLSGWAKRVRLTIDHNDIDAALSNFPILVHLSASSGRNGGDVSFVFDELQGDVNRKKITVTTSDGETQCYVEIEKWDDANEQAWLWVRVPSVASDADIDLYLYYDSSHADNTAYVGDPSDAVVHNVWDSNFKLVCHMRDDPDASHVRDSTGNNNDGTKKAANEPVEVDGKVGKAQDLDGIDDYVEIAHSDVLDFTAEYTLEVMIEPHALKNYGVIFCRGSGNVDDIEVYIRATDFVTLHNRNNGGTMSYQSWTNPPANQSTRLVITWSEQEWSLYYDGVLKGTSGTKINPLDTDRKWLFGANEGAFSPPYLDGIYDEVRISDIARSAAWIKASNESERDHLVDFGSEESTIAAAAYTKFNRGFN